MNIEIIKTENGDNEVFSKYDEAIDLLQEAVSFMNLVPNNKYGDNYTLCSKIRDFIENK